MNSKRSKVKGVTLIEVLLVLVIIGSIMYLAVGYLQQQAQQSRMDKTVIQMQQALNGGLAYYVANGAWPGNLSCLQGSGSGCSVEYIPSNFVPPWGGQNYHVVNANGILYIYFKLDIGTQANAIANVLAGRLPLGYATHTDASGSAPPPDDGSCSAAGSQSYCYVVASVNIPGQNLNNATAINFAGIYTNGGCIPVPQCPVDSNGKTMIPEVMVAPVSVSGIVSYNNLNGVGSGSKVIYNQAITSFTAYATSDNSSGKVPTSTAPYDCGTSSPGDDCASNETGKTPAQAYWRACVQITTEKGDISQWSDDTEWGKKVTLMAVTRCTIKNETSGSGFSIYSNGKD